MRSLNSRTLTKKVWGKFRKLNRNYKPGTLQSLKRGRNIITLPEEITDTFADHCANISRDPHKKIKPEKTERGKKKTSYHIVNHLQTEY